MNIPTSQLTPFEQSERNCLRMQVAIDQYKNDLRQHTTNAQVTEAGLQAIVKKYTQLANECECTVVKLICSNIIEDAKQLITINQTSFKI